VIDMAIGNRSTAEGAIGARASSFRDAQQRYLEAEGVTATDRFLSLTDLRLRAHLLEAGVGDPVLLVHGGGGVAAHWAPLMARLRGHHLIAVDRPGCGLSDPFDNRGIDLRSHALAFLSGVLEGLDLSRVHIIANSMGGLWALWFALEAPTRVRSLSLLGCPANVLGTSAPFPLRLLSVPGLNRMMFSLEAPSAPQVRTLFARIGHTETELSAQFVELMIGVERLPAYREHWLSLMENIYFMTRKRVGISADELRGVTQPVQLVWGTRDPFGAPTIGAEMVALLPDASLTTLDAGHLPWISEPDRSAEIIADFLVRQQTDNLRAH